MPTGAEDSSVPGISVATWQGQYLEGLVTSRGLSESAASEIVRTLDRAFEHIPSPGTVTGPHRVTGALVGAIQSGKTAAMIGVSARALDRGFRIVLVLAGLRDDLRTQTALRFGIDLLQRGDEIFPREGQRRFTHPLGDGYHGEMGDQCWSPKFSDDVNQDDAFQSRLARVLRSGRSALVVAKKNLRTLDALTDAVAYAERQCGAGRLPTVVVDDECDEASVGEGDDAPTPDRVCGVWRDLNQYVVYIGFTATPAANLLQDTEAQLFPRDFVDVLRTPGDATGALSIQEAEPDRRYTGGDTFYRLLESRDRDNFLVRARMSDGELNGHPGESGELEQALLAYFVSGAIRLAQAPDRSFANREQLPRPHTMLAHTEVLVQEHWDLCERVVALTRQRGGADPTVKENLRRVRPNQRLNPSHLAHWLRNDETQWRAWYDDFHASYNTLLEVSPDRSRPEFPSWESVATRLTEVFEHTQLRVINSDEASSDEPLSFRPSYSGGALKPPTDVFSIVIGGNRLSRGLTIEGLCVSYYTRSAGRFMEDSTVQRERWFGYRGAHLEFCRLFTHRDLAIRLTRFHEHDEDLRRQLAWNITHGRQPSDSTLRFLRLGDSRPTAKIGRGIEDSIEISGVRLFFDRVQMGTSDLERSAAEWNQSRALELADRLELEGRELSDQKGRLVGLVLGDVQGEVVADYLDDYRYVFHNPDPDSGVQFNIREWYRQPCSGFARTNKGLAPRRDPYLVAAYLRFWADAYAKCESRVAHHRFRGRDGISPWRPCPVPSFNLALRVGTIEPDKERSPFKRNLMNRAVSSSGEIGSRWGAHGYLSNGDEWIDIEPPNGDKEAPRGIGTPGLALLHVIARKARGRSGEGQTYEFERPTFGVVIPEGGPCIQFVLASPP